METFKFLLFGFFSVFLVASLVVAQPASEIVRDETFVPVSSAFVGCRDNGCFVASMTSMLASLNDTQIGTNTTAILSELNVTLVRYNGGNYPFPTYVVVEAAVNFLINLI
ncbi:MAG: hypothetical protein AABX10_01055 [Nanoarchaeota archaeon]